MMEASDKVDPSLVELWARESAAVWRHQAKFYRMMDEAELAAECDRRAEAEDALAKEKRREWRAGHAYIRLTTRAAFTTGVRLEDGTPLIAPERLRTAR